jgi:hypothetical protein
MAGNAVVGALRVTLGLDSAQFTTGMKTAQTGLQRFAGIAKAGALAIGSAMVAAGGAMALAMRAVVNDADEMSKMAQKIGVPIEELSRLRYAAELSDISLENLEKSLRRLSAGMLDASENATGPAASAFAMLGISVKDAEGNIRSSTSVIEDLAARFARMPDGVEKTALAMRIFGKSGADMIPLLNSGADGLREMYEEAEQLGIVLDRETGLAAERFNDNLTRLGKTKDGIVTKVTAGMLPAFDRLAASLVATANDSNGLRLAGRGLGIVMNGLVAIIMGVVGALWAAGLAAAAYGKTMERLAKLDFVGAAVAWATSTDRVAQSIAGTVNQIKALFTAAPPAAAAIEGLGDETEDLADRTTRAGRATRGLTDAQREAADAARELAQEAAQVFEQTRTPAEQYATEVERLTRLLNAAAISQDTFNRAMREANIRRDADDPLSQAGRRIAEENREAAEHRREDAIEFARDHEENLRASTYDGIRSGLQAAADGNLGQYLAQRLRDALFDGLADTLTNMLRGPKGSSGGGAAGWLGALGSVFKTFAGGLPGFKTGGSFKVGGSGGADSQLMQFRATPGEMVDIRRPGQDQGGGQMAVHVVPSPYFDVQVERIAGPVAQQAAGQMGRQVLDASRRSAPGIQNRQRLLGTT